MVKNIVRLKYRLGVAYPANICLFCTLLNSRHYDLFSLLIVWAYLQSLLINSLEKAIQGKVVRYRRSRSSKLVPLESPLHMRLPISLPFLPHDATQARP